MQRRSCSTTPGTLHSAFRNKKYLLRPLFQKFLSRCFTLRPQDEARAYDNRREESSYKWKNGRKFGFFWTRNRNGTFPCKRKWRGVNRLRIFYPWCLKKKIVFLYSINGTSDGQYMEGWFPQWKVENKGKNANKWKVWMFPAMNVKCKDVLC